MTASTHQFIRAALDEIRHSSHANAGFTICLAGAAVASLGQACVSISSGSAERLSAIVLALAQWADDDLTALNQWLELREQSREEEGQAILISGPMEIAGLACEGAEILQQFRPRVIEQVRDDMEFALHLLAATARASLMLVESNLRQWRAPSLHARFGPEVERLTRRIEALQPLKHIEWT